MAVPEDVQQLLIGNSCGIIIDLNRFRMVAEASICRGRFGAAAVAYARTDYALNAPEPGVRPPESAKPKGGGFSV